MSFVQQAATSVFDDDVAGAFDIVGFDPRGVGDSTAVTCLDAEDMDAYLYDVPEAERGTPEWESEVAEGNRAFIDACTENTGELLEFITTEQAARDLDLIRAVLGEEKLRYLGFSYGTFLGATYAGLFPERAGSLVLDAAIDPSVPSSMVGAAQGVGFEDSLRAYLSNCEQAGQCPFPGSVDDGMSDLAALLADVDRSPVAGPDGRELGADTLVTAIISSLYSPASWPQLTQALTGVQKGDATAAFLLADAYNSRTEGGYMDNSTEAFSAYNCMDYPVSTEAEEREAEQLVQEKAPTDSPYWFRPRPVRGLALPAHRDTRRDHGGGRRPDPRRRHDGRPGDAVCVGRVARRPALERDAPHIRGGGAQRVRQWERVHRRRGGGVPPRRGGPEGRSHLPLTAAGRPSSAARAAARPIRCAER